MANIVVAIYNSLRRVNGIFPYVETFLNGLRDRGNNVLCFEKIAAELEISSELPLKYKEKIEQFKPDLFILFNNQFWDVSKYFDVPVVIYDIDSPNVYANVNLLKENKKFKYFCITKSGKNIIKEVIGCEESDICYIPPFTGVIAQSLPNERAIGFCGSHWLWNDLNEFNKFILQNPSKQDKENAKRVYKEYKENSYLLPSQIYENLGINAVNKIETNNLYIFSTRISGIKRLRYLLEIEDLGLEIRGEHWNNMTCHMLKAFPELLLSYSSEVINNTLTTQNFYNSSKIGFNTTHIQAKTGFGWRVADILASNACLVTEKSSDLLELGFDIPTYSTPAEARELCIKLLNDEPYRQSIVEKCHELIDKNHRFSNVLPLMEEFLNMNLHSENVGTLEFIRTDCKSKKGPLLKVKLKDKIRLKIYKYLDKKLKRKNLI